MISVTRNNLLLMKRDKGSEFIDFIDNILKLLISPSTYLSVIRYDSCNNVSLISPKVIANDDFLIFRAEIHNSEQLTRSRNFTFDYQQISIGNRFKWAVLEHRTISSHSSEPFEHIQMTVQVSSFSLNIHSFIVWSNRKPSFICSGKSSIFRIVPLKGRSSWVTRQFVICVGTLKASLWINRIVPWDPLICHHQLFAIVRDSDACENWN